MVEAREGYAKLGEAVCALLQKGRGGVQVTATAEKGGGTILFLNTGDGKFTQEFCVSMPQLANVPHSS